MVGNRFTLNHLHISKPHAAWNFVLQCSCKSKSARVNKTVVVAVAIYSGVLEEAEFAICNSTQKNTNLLSLPFVHERWCVDLTLNETTGFSLKNSPAQCAEIHMFCPGKLLLCCVNESMSLKMCFLQMSFIVSINFTWATVYSML